MDLRVCIVVCVLAYQHELRGFLHGFVDAWEDTGATIGEGIESRRDRHAPGAHGRKGVCETDVIRGGSHDDPGEEKQRADYTPNGGEGERAKIAEPDRWQNDEGREGYHKVAVAKAREAEARVREDIVEVVSYGDAIAEEGSGDLDVEERGDDAAHAGPERHARDVLVGAACVGVEGHATAHEACRVRVGGRHDKRHGHARPSRARHRVRGRQYTKPCTMHGGGKP